jgi:hypothetical protein
MANRGPASNTAEEERIASKSATVPTIKSFMHDSGGAIFEQVIFGLTSVHDDLAVG